MWDNDDNTTVDDESDNDNGDDTYDCVSNICDGNSNDYRSKYISRHSDQRIIRLQ